MSETISYETLMEQYLVEKQEGLTRLLGAWQARWKAKPLRERASYQVWCYWTIYIADPWKSLRTRLADWLYPYGDKYE